MIKAKPEDKNLIKDILVQSFQNNLTVNYIVKQDAKKLERIRSLIDYSFEICSLFGEVWLSDDKKASALILYPHLKKTTPKSIWLDIKLIFQAIGISGIPRALKLEDMIKARQPKEPMVYLWFIGVNPMYQHNGIGTTLLKEVINNEDTRHLPVFLETSTIKNMPWYKRFNFRVYDELALDYVLYFLKREPAN